MLRAARALRLPWFHLQYPAALGMVGGFSSVHVLLPAVSEPAAWYLLHVYVLRCFSHVPSHHYCQDVGICQIEQCAWPLSRVSLIVFLAGTVLNPAA